MIFPCETVDKHVASYFPGRHSKWHYAKPDTERAGNHPSHLCACAWWATSFYWNSKLRNWRNQNTYTSADAVYENDFYRSLWGFHALHFVLYKHMAESSGNKIRILKFPCECPVVGDLGYINDMKVLSSDIIFPPIGRQELICVEFLTTQCTEEYFSLPCVWFVRHKWCLAKLKFANEFNSQKF